jgi:glycosyltransferase involved in cell wall biosynthesis
VIATGRIVPQRRPDAAARILASVADVADVAWIGGGGGGGAYGSRVRAALAADGVELTGWLPREALLDELARAIVYLHWTAWDSRSIAILEAMARDAIVVASDTDPNRELLDPRQICATEADAIALVRHVLADSEFAAELLAAQVDRRRVHSAAEMVAGWLGVYGELADRPRVHGTT